MSEVKFDEKKFQELANDVNSQIKDLETKLESKAAAENLTEIQKSFTKLQEDLNGVMMIGDKKTVEYIQNTEKYAQQLESEIKLLKDKKGQEPRTFKTFLKEFTESDDFKEKFIGQGKKGYIEKAAADLLTSDWTADSGTVGLLQYDIPGVTKHPWRDNPIMAAVQKRFIGEKVDAVRYTEELTRTDSAATTSEGSAAPQSAATWIAKMLNFYKQTHLAKVSEENYEDSEYISGEIDDLLRNGLLRLVETKFATGSGSSDVKGITVSAQTFAKPVNMSAVSNPNIYDVLRAAKLYVRKGYNAVASNDTNKKGYNANIALVSPEIMAEMDMQKDQNNQYILPPFRDANGQRVAGMVILESEDLDSADHFLVGDFTKAVAYIKRNLRIEKGYDDDDFSKDLSTLKASMRTCMLVKSLHEYAFVYGTFTNGITAIGA